MTSDEVFLSPDAVRNGADNFSASAASLHEAWTRFRSIATGLNISSTWGTDRAGNSFNEEYMGGENYVEQLMTGTQELIELTDKLGPGVRSCVDGTIEADELVATWFTSTEE